MCKITGSKATDGEWNAGQAYRVFFQALKSDDVEAVVAAAHDFFGLPVLLTDENYRLICQFPKKNLNQEIWDTLLETGTLPQETIEAYQQMYLNMDGPFYEPFYSKDGLAADCPRIFGEVHSKEKIYGHIAIFMYSRPLGANDLAAAQVFIDALGMLMLPRRNRGSDTMASYLRDLLSTDTAPQVRALAMRCVRGEIGGPYTLMVTPIGDTASQRAFASMVISNMPEKYRQTVSTIYRDCIVTLFGLMQGGSHTQKEEAFFGRVAEYLSPAREPSGISRPFSSLEELQGHFQQAYTTSRVSRRQFDFFDNVFPAQIFKAAASLIDPSMFIHPAIEAVRRYDGENETEYYDTLRVYSLSLHDREATAKTLCIHRNTLAYRLGRISELFDIPFEEPRTALALLNSFQLIEACDANGGVPVNREK